VQQLWIEMSRVETSARLNSPEHFPSFSQLSILTERPVISDFSVAGSFIPAEPSCASCMILAAYFERMVFNS
jgi:hypothetical protein